MSSQLRLTEIMGGKEKLALEVNSCISIICRVASSGKMGSFLSTCHQLLLFLANCTSSASRAHPRTNNTFLHVFI